jgi:hypothetical protein
MTEPMAADDVCEHHYETRILGGHPIHVTACTFCRTPDWADLREQAAELYRWGWQEGRDGKARRATLSAYDKPREATEVAPRTTPDNSATSGDAADNPLREQYAAAVECAIGLNVDCGGTEGVHRVRDAVLAVRDAELERLEKLHQAHLRVEAPLAGGSLVAEATVERVRLLIAAHRPRLRLADPVLLGKLERVLEQPAELEAAVGGEQP